MMYSLNIIKLYILQKKNILRYGHPYGRLSEGLPAALSWLFQSRKWYRKAFLLARFIFFLGRARNRVVLNPVIRWMWTDSTFFVAKTQRGVTRRVIVLQQEAVRPFFFALPRPTRDMQFLGKLLSSQSSVWTNHSYNFFHVSVCFWGRRHVLTVVRLQSTRFRFWIAHITCK